MQHDRYDFGAWVAILEALDDESGLVMYLVRLDRFTWHIIDSASGLVPKVYAHLLNTSMLIIKITSEYLKNRSRC